MKPGTPVSAVLTALTEKGFRIKWKPDQVMPTMTLLEKPRSTRVDNLLNEILEPYGMRARRRPHARRIPGQRRVKKKSKKYAVEQTSPP